LAKFFGDANYEDALSSLRDAVPSSVKEGVSNFVTEFFSGESDFLSDVSACESAKIGYVFHYKCDGAQLIEEAQVVFVVCHPFVVDVSGCVLCDFPKLCASYPGEWLARWSSDQDSGVEEIAFGLKNGGVYIPDVLRH
jgi:hypothetical protein